MALMHNETSVVIVGEPGFIGVFDLVEMKQPCIFNAFSYTFMPNNISRIDGRPKVFAIGTAFRMYIVEINVETSKITHLSSIMHNDKSVGENEMCIYSMAQIETTPTFLVNSGSYPDTFYWKVDT